jgi:hypothetical protein
VCVVCVLCVCCVCVCKCVHMCVLNMCPHTTIYFVLILPHTSISLCAYCGRWCVMCARLDIRNVASLS